MNKKLVIIMIILFNTVVFGSTYKEILKQQEETKVIEVKLALYSIDALYKALEKQRSLDKVYNKKSFYTQKDSGKRMFCLGNSINMCESYLMHKPYGYFAKEIADYLVSKKKNLADVYILFDDKEFEKFYYSLVVKENAKIGYKMYIDTFPNGTYIKDAKKNFNHYMTAMEKYMEWNKKRNLVIEQKEKRRKEKAEERTKIAIDSMTPEQYKQYEKIERFWPGEEKTEAIKSLKLKKDCENGVGKSCYDYTGKLKDKYNDEKVEYILKSCNLGYDLGCQIMSSIYKEGWYGIAKNPRKAKVFFRKYRVLSK